MSQGGFEWFAIKTVSGQEKKVRGYLESEIKRLKFEQFIEQILIPTERVFEIRNGKKKSREKILFPGYIFIKLHVTYNDGVSVIQPEIFQTIKDVPNVVGFVGGERGKVPQPLRKTEIDGILAKMDELEETGEVLETPFSRGESIKVMDGPFNGFTGVVEEVMDDKRKLKVMVKIFGRNTPVELNYLQVERVQ